MGHELSPSDTRAVEFVCGPNQAVRRVVEQVIERQAASLALGRRARRALVGAPAFTTYLPAVLPICLERARDSRVTDVDGHEYVDCHMANSATVLGHSPPAVRDAVREHLDRGLSAGQFFREQVELAELIQRLVPGAERVLLLHTGGEAIHAAVRVARAATGRPLVAKFEGCYHGWGEVGVYNSMMSLSGRVPTSPLNQIPPHPDTAGVSQGAGSDLVILPFNDPVALERVRDLADRLACVVVDPVPPFMAPWIDEAAAFVTRLRQTTTDAGIPLIFDEVVSGFRLAPGGAQECFGVTADLACFGKITSGCGVPLSVVAGSAALLDAAASDGVFADFRARKAWVSSTHKGNFVAVVAALAALRLHAESFREFTGRLDRQHARVAEELRDFCRRSGIPAELHGHPRLQSLVGLGHPLPATHTYRAIMGSASPWHFRPLLALTLYLRLHGVYTPVLPTMNLSVAHTDDDVGHILRALQSCLLELRRDGLLGLT